MNAVQMLTGRGGWPMSMFLTPELQPFYGGTYWPDSSRGGMPGFDQVLDGKHVRLDLRRRLNRVATIDEDSSALFEHDGCAGRRLSRRPRLTTASEERP